MVLVLCRFRVQGAGFWVYVGLGFRVLGLCRV